MAVALRKYSSSVPSKQSKTVKCDLSGNFSPLRVPRPSICSKRMRDFTGRRKTMNSRSGISTPGGQQVHRDHDAGFGRLRNSRMRCSGRSTAAGDLLDEGVAPAEDIAGRCRRAGRRGRCAAGRWRRRSASSGTGRIAPRARSAYFLISSMILRFESGAVTFARSRSASNCRSSSSRSSCLGPVSGIDRRRPARLPSGRRRSCGRRT